jgi:hypothetical protein
MIDNNTANNNKGKESTTDNTGGLAATLSKKLKGLNGD